MWILIYIRYVYNIFLFMYVIYFLFIFLRIIYLLICYKFIGGEMMFLLFKLGFNFIYNFIVIKILCLLFKN